MDQSLEGAIEDGDVAKVQRLLRKDRRWFDPEVGNAAILHAAKLGKLEIIRLLLTDKRVDPTVNKNKAIYRAAFYGNIEIVRLLLSDERVNPADNDNRALRAAAERDHAEIVRLLLTDPRVNSSDAFNEALRKAAWNGNVDVVRVLLADNRVHPGTKNNEIIETTASYLNLFWPVYRLKFLEIVKLLAVDPRVDPTVNDNTIIRTAIAKDQRELVRFLFAIPKVATSIIDFYLAGIKRGESPNLLQDLATMTGAESTDPVDLLAWAAGAGSLPLVQYWIDQYQIDPTIDNNLLLRTARTYGREEIVEYLAQFLKLNIDQGAGLPISSDIAYITVDQYFNNPALAIQFDQVVQSALEVAIVDPLAHFMEYDHASKDPGQFVPVGVLTNTIIHQTDRQIRNPKRNVKSPEYYQNYYMELAPVFLEFYANLQAIYPAAVASVRTQYPPDTKMLVALFQYVWSNITRPPSL